MTLPARRHRLGERLVVVGIGGRHVEQDVEGDRPGAALRESIDQRRVQRPRPRPRQSDLGEGQLVDRDDDDIGRGLGAGGLRAACRRS